MKVTKLLLVSLFLLQPWLLSGVIRFEVFVGLFCILLFFCKNKTIVFPMSEMNILLFSFIIIISSVLIHGESDISLLKKYLSLAFLIVSGFYIVNLLGIRRKDIISAIKICVIFSLVFYLLCIQFTFLRELSLQLKGETYGIEEKLEVYRLWFPTSAHTFHLGLFFFLTTVILLAEKSNFIFVFMSIICASIAARSAMLMSILLCIVFIFIKERKYLIIVLLAIPLFYFSITTLSNEYISVRYALEPLETLIDTGTIQSKSSDDLINKHLYIPNAESILIGDGIYSNNDGTFYGHTDSGYVRPILYGGILFLIGYLFFAWHYLRCLKVYGFFGMLILASFFFANIKAEILTSTPYFSLIILLYFTIRNEKRDFYKT